MTTDESWGAGEQPWIRQAGRGAAIPCPFCGRANVVVSFHDESADPGRVQLYCESDGCEAREIEVVVMRDGASSHRRSDVRALRAIDRGRRREAAQALNFTEFMNAPLEDPVPHRMNEQARTIHLD